MRWKMRDYITDDLSLDIFSSRDGLIFKRINHRRKKRSTNMKRTSQKPTLAFVLFVVAAVSGCQQQPDYESSLKPLVDKYNEAWNTGNANDLDAIVDPAFIRQSDIATSVEGLHDLKALIADFRKAYPDLRIVLEDEIYGKDKFVGRWTLTATATGKEGTRATGEPIRVWGINIIHFHNGRIVKEYDAYDNLPFMVERGFSITPP